MPVVKITGFLFALKLLVMPSNINLRQLSLNSSTSFTTRLLWAYIKRKSQLLAFLTGITLHPKGIEPLFQEPESCVISITLRVATTILYHIETKRKDLEIKSFLIYNYNSMSPNKSAIENPV